ncbi:hypothetical protein DNTS_031861 [Danionella cerebrum]|uniref:Uncharacterized protein n=1 Tax=Danionella cerebrum TaxID=2873325 RepID=A0A553MT19_9TELE|nr:hypothetical protein DNTS_031861 [Danionella translucida]
MDQGVGSLPEHDINVPQEGAKPLLITRRVHQTQARLCFAPCTACSCIILPVERASWLLRRDGAVKHCTFTFTNGEVQRLNVGNAHQTARKFLQDHPDPFIRSSCSSLEDEERTDAARGESRAK